MLDALEASEKVVPKQRGNVHAHDLEKKRSHGCGGWRRTVCCEEELRVRSTSEQTSRRETKSSLNQLKLPLITQHDRIASCSRVEGTSTGVAKLHSVSSGVSETARRMTAPSASSANRTGRGSVSWCWMMERNTETAVGLDRMKSLMSLLRVERTAFLELMEECGATLRRGKTHTNGKERE